MQKWQAQMERKALERNRLEVAARMIAGTGSTGATALAVHAKHLSTLGANEGIARGSAHTKTRKAHQMCSGDGQCGTTDPSHCGGRYFAARTKHQVSRTDDTDRLHRAGKSYQIANALLKSAPCKK